MQCLLRSVMHIQIDDSGCDRYCFVFLVQLYKQLIPMHGLVSKVVLALGCTIISLSSVLYQYKMTRPPPHAQRLLIIYTILMLKTIIS